MADDSDHQAYVGPMGFPHIEDPSAPIIYVDICAGGGPTFAGDNIALTFCTRGLNHTVTPPQSVSKTVLRLVMPRVSALALADFIRQITAPPDAGGPPTSANTTIN